MNRKLGNERATINEQETLDERATINEQETWERKGNYK